MKEIMLHKNIHCVLCHTDNEFETWGYGANGSRKKYVTINTRHDSIESYINRLMGY